MQKAYEKQAQGPDKSDLKNGYLEAAIEAENHASRSLTGSVRLTGHTARRTKPPARDTILWDDDVPGFGMRWRASGTKAWIVRYRLRGRIRFITLGNPPKMKASEARAKARKLRAEANLVGLPIKLPKQTGEGMTVAGFADEFLASAKGRWKDSTFKSNAYAVRRELLPIFGDLPLTSINKADIVRWRDDMAARTGTFNRTVPVLSALLQESENFGYRAKGSNPAKGMPRYKRKRSERYLSAQEYRVLGAVLKDAEGEMPLAVPVIRLLLYTGARAGEITNLRCEWVKPPRILLPDSKTGPRVIYLNEPAEAILAKVIGGREDGLVFPAPCKPSVAFNVTAHWYILRGRAGLNDVRLHDLRHSFASLAIRDGISLTLIGKLLGHSLPESTERYTHLADDIVSEAADRVCASIASSLGLQA